MKTEEISREELRQFARALLVEHFGFNPDGLTNFELENMRNLLLAMRK